MTKNPPRRMDESRVQSLENVFLNKVMRGLYMMSFSAPQSWDIEMACGSKLKISYGTLIYLHFC